MTDSLDSEDGSEGRWVTINEAAAITGRHPNTIRNWVRDGRFNHVGEEPYAGGVRYLLAEDEVMTMIAIPERPNALPTTRGGWDRLAAQVRGLADLVEEAADLRLRVTKAEAEVARLSEESRTLLERLEGGG